MTKKIYLGTFKKCAGSLCFSLLAKQLTGFHMKLNTGLKRANYFCTKSSYYIFFKVLNGTNYSRMHQVKFVEDSLEGVLSALSRPYSSNFLKAVFHKFYLVHS